MPNHQVGQCLTVHGVMGCCSQGKQNGLLLQVVTQMNQPRCRHHQLRARATEEPTNRAPAACTGHKNRVAFLKPAYTRAELDNLSHRFIARNQGVAHARKVGHFTGVEKPLGARADTTKKGLNNDVLCRRLAERQSAPVECSGCLQHHSLCGSLCHFLWTNLLSSYAYSFHLSLFNRLVNGR